MNLFSKMVAATLLCVGTNAVALQSDRSQPITIDADSAERDELAGTTTYSGKVEMAQGSMRINADEIVIYNTKDKVTKIIAKGKPAAYQQKPSDKAGKVVAKANILEYRIDQETLRLLEGASLQQEGTSLSGTTIEYDVRKSVVKADSNNKDSGRVRMVIPPKALRSELPDSEVNDPKSNQTNPENATQGQLDDKRETPNMPTTPDQSAVTGIDNGHS